MKKCKSLFIILLLSNIVFILVFFIFNKPTTETITIIQPGDSTFTKIDSLNKLSPIRILSINIISNKKQDPIIKYKTDLSGNNIIDTNEIKRRYELILKSKDSLIHVLSERVFYSDTISNDSTEIEVVINLEIQDNKLAFREYFFKNKRPKIINQTIISNDLRNFYWGFNVGYHFDNDVLFGANLDYQYNNSLIGINATTGFTPINRFILLRYSTKF